MRLLNGYMNPKDLIKMFHTYRIYSNINFYKYKNKIKNQFKK